KAAGRLARHGSDVDDIAIATLGGRAGGRIEALFDQQAPGVANLQIETELFGAIGRVEGRRNGPGGNAEEGSRHLGAIGQDHGDAILTGDAKAPKGAHDTLRLPKQSGTAEPSTSRRLYGYRRCVTGSQSRMDRGRRRHREETRHVVAPESVGAMDGLQKAGANVLDMPAHKFFRPSGIAPGDRRHISAVVTAIGLPTLGRKRCLAQLAPGLLV